LFYGIQTLRQYLEMPEHPAMEINDWPELAMRSDYLDMRGLFPKFENLLKYVEEMARYKLNTLVIEYEDKLPRSRKEFCHPLDALTPEQHALLLKTAHDHFIDVIPLQQSFGHLEYALKLPEYQHLRELPEAPGEMCPLREGSFELAASLIEETARLHPDSRYLHLGCDEVWSLGQSPECRASGKSRGRIAIEFINRLAEKVLSLGKTPIVWHDMLANVWKDGDMGEAGNYDELALINKNIVVAIWLYSPDRVNIVAPRLMETLHAHGIKTLPCCAIRASDRCGMQNYPCIEQRLRNVDAWCELIAQSRCDGMVNTNWCSTFSFGNPYGLFETSRYTAFYAADRCWNLRANSAAFLERFMGVYHGAYKIELTTGAERRYDYYKLMGQYLPLVTRNKDTARLIDVMYRQEYAASVNFAAFRGDLFPNSKVELDCLRERAPKQYANLHRIEAELREILARLLTPEMAELFFESRSYPNRLYQRELERILEMPLA
jgi:hexosaminidase